MTIGIMTAIGIEEVKNIRDIGIERRDRSQQMFAIIAAGLAIGPMSVTCRKSRSKLYIFYNIKILYFYPNSKPYQSGSQNSGSQYSSNSIDHKPKKDYADKKEKAKPGPNLENKTEQPLKEQEKIKEEPSKPKEI